MAGATQRLAIDPDAAPRDVRPGADPEAALLPVLDGLARAFGYERALVALADERARVIHGRFGRGIADHLADAFSVPLANLQDPSVVAFHSGVPQRVDDVAADVRVTPATRDILLELGFDSFIVAPLRSPGEPPIGVVILSKGSPASDADVQALAPFANQAGSLLAQARDVAELRLGGEAHAIEKEWLWWMVNAFADPVVVTDEQNELVLANHSAELLFKSGKDDSAGKAHAISMNNFLFTAALSTWNLQSALERTRELTLVDPIEGDELIFEVITSPATNYRIGARGVVSVLKNVTDLRHVTQELSANIQRLQSVDQEIRMERDRLDLVLRNVPNPIIVVDNMNEIVSMNAAAEHLFKPPHEPLVQSRRAQVAMRNDAKFTSFLAQLSLDPASNRTGELRLTDVDTGEELELQVTANEVRDTVGAAIATVSVMQDVGRLRELERRRLEQALFDSEKLAATGRLAASIAHEINNPLEAIQNALYLLVKRIPDDDPNAKFLNIAMKETERMSRILRQMLGFYRPAADLTPTDLNALIDEAEALVAKRLREQNVKVERLLQPDLPRVMASADQIKQVILNLVLNAAEAMPKGGVVTVTTEAHRDAGSAFIRTDAVRVQVADTGPGIAEEFLPHIFEPFFSTKGEKGTGLGLWVSLGIAQSHGGRLQVRNRPGGGTVFSMTLPIGGPPDAA
ncbi:MAG: ATP-binding protein [Chloroflexota bacterium]|nr:ATP-binding protein [Chloroflexota bacterium]